MDQYANSLRDLAEDPRLDLALHADPAPDGNVLPPSALRVTGQLVAELDDNAWRIAPALRRRLHEQLGCAPAADASCLARTLETLALWFHRRPPDAATRTRYGSLFDRLRAGGADDDTAVEALVAAFAQAPEFVYRWDAPRGPAVAPGIRRLDDWQLAEQLALFVWRSGPDDVLRQAASQGLTDPKVVEREVRRLLDDPRARRGTSHFVSQWLMLGGLEDKSKDEPGWSPALGRVFQEDTERVFGALMTAPNTTFADLFSHSTAWITRDNATLLGERAGTDASGRMAELGGRRRTGLLTHNSFLTAHAKVKGSSPILRGVTIVKQILCQDIASPPDDLEIPPEPEHGPGTTAREVLAEHRANPVCTGCHRLIDPPGLALELWDGLGRFRLTEDGAPIDPSGELPIDDGAPFAFRTPEELFARLGSAVITRQCFIGRWLEQGLGKAVALAEERCALEDLDASLATSGHGLRTTLERIASHPSLSLRREGAAR
jgi:hypothetical protein